MFKGPNLKKKLMYKKIKKTHIKLVNKIIKVKKNKKKLLKKLSRWLKLKTFLSHISKE